MKNFLIRAWNYFKNSWEGDDGKASWKRISQYVFVVSMIGAGRRVHDQWSFYTFLTFAVIYVLVAAIMTWQQVISLLRFTLPQLGKTDTLISDVEPGIEAIEEEITKAE